VQHIQLNYVMLWCQIFCEK